MTPIALLLPLLAFINGCGEENPTVEEETIKISDLTVSVDGDRATIRWKTDVPADSLVDYGVSAAYGMNVTDLDGNVSTAPDSTFNGNFRYF